MKNSPLKICNETIHPGERVSLALPLPELFSCAPMYMPIKVIRGKEKGPCLLILAAMRGNQLNGTEIINRLLDHTILKRLQGTLIAIPVMNVYGLINRSHYLPGGIELDRNFPGSKTGSHAARLADLFTKEILDKADYCIDLQTGLLNHTNLPQICVNFENEKAKELAKAFGAPVISDTPIEKGSLRSLTEKKNIPLLVYEAGEAMRFDEHAIKVGIKGILNVMRNLNLLPEPSRRYPPKTTNSFFTKGNIWVRASTSGMSYSKFKLGQRVSKGEILCTIKNPFGAGESATITSPQEGVIVGKNNLPLVHEGETLFQIAVFPEMEKAATHLKNWKEQSIEQLEEFE
ncbi:peptidase M14 [Coxiella burnetii]|uniref:Succinylglutamate desuccinylase/Aspartoacylase family protein n=1 Tax=Coxiella burnetii (strain Dugway 5J108-111) TaxID=434922 RepID=A9KCV6_COXBN|nr:succinylglutamate desuccinylase/aspartoacylase family protein [Coxiella burnetii]ABS76926.1 succinylglutamate desuccinylase/Aspartoacylase family protein [Coxiella burnetii Dugway 5J108-111]OYK79859.1 peptidase M14 [Coxiella burnetii]OYK81941.1 peptidase M14 [Coxiella burnetii]